MNGACHLFITSFMMPDANVEQLCGALFTSKFFCKIRIVALSFVFDKYCSIMDKLGSIDSSRQFRPNCAINFYFYLYLILHAYV